MLTVPVPLVEKKLKSLSSGKSSNHDCLDPVRYKLDIELTEAFVTVSASVLMTTLWPDVSVPLNPITEGEDG